MLSLLSATLMAIENSMAHCYLCFTAHSTSKSDQVVKREICSIITKGKFLIFCISNLKQDLLCNCHKFMQIMSLVTQVTLVIVTIVTQVTKGTSVILVTLVTQVTPVSQVTLVIQVTLVCQVTQVTVVTQVRDLVYCG